jgi:hypothetical protein
VFQIGLYALQLMPKEYSANIVYITNGVNTTTGAKETVSRQTFRSIMDNFVNFCVIQVGCNQGFTPNVDFAHVPNQEYLQFMCDTVCGTFLYSSDLPYAADESINFYHKLLAIRQLDSGEDLSRNRPVDSVQVLNANTEGFDMSSNEEKSFPWITTSRPPVVTKVLCGYRDYKMPGENLHHIIHARVKDGFKITELSVKKKQKSNLDKVEITFEAVWLPQVTISYTIKFSGI